MLECVLLRSVFTFGVDSKLWKIIGVKVFHFYSPILSEIMILSKIRLYLKVLG